MVITRIAYLKGSLLTQITIIITLYVSVLLCECKCKHAIVNVWRPEEDRGSQFSSTVGLGIELMQSVLYNMIVPSNILSHLTGPKNRNYKADKYKHS